MLRRPNSILILSLLTAALLATSATALTIDGSVREALADKADGTVPLMMILDEPADLAALEPSLRGMTPDQRRRAVIDHLRTHAARVEAPFRADLEDAADRGRVDKVVSLYLANAMLLNADAEAVDALAAGKARGTLFHDRSYDLISGVMAPEQGEAADASSGRANAWSIEWINADDVWGLATPATASWSATSTRAST